MAPKAPSIDSHLNLCNWALSKFPRASFSCTTSNSDHFFGEKILLERYNLLMLLVSHPREYSQPDQLHCGFCSAASWACAILNVLGTPLISLSRWNSKFQKSLDAEISSDSPNPSVTLNRRSDNATTGSHTAEFEHASASPLPRGEPALSQIPATVLCFSFSNLRSISKPPLHIQRIQNFV